MGGCVGGRVRRNIPEENQQGSKKQSKKKDRPDRIFRISKEFQDRLPRAGTSGCRTNRGWVAFCSASFRKLFRLIFWMSPSSPSEFETDSEVSRRNSPFFPPPPPSTRAYDDPHSLC